MLSRLNDYIRQSIRLETMPSQLIKGYIEKFVSWTPIENYFTSVTVSQTNLKLMLNYEEYY